MAVTKTALVLLYCACSTLAWENLPQIPANRRAEYYLQHDDGAYKYAYDTGDGQSALVNADATNQVVGQWQYVDNNGQRVNWQYTAGDGGYVPVMSAVAGGGAAGKTAHAAQTKVTGYQASFGGYGSGSGGHSASYEGHGSGSGTGHGIASAKSTDADYDENADASYAFDIDTAEYKRSESSDPKGNIKGEYSYSSPVGGSHAISYLAGSDTGFVVTKTTSDESGIVAKKSGSYQQHHVSAPAPITPYSGPLSDAVAQHNPDGSFSYSYSTGDHSHTATGDAKNNVRGSYTFTAKDDGLQRTVNYHAGSATGYVASGDHLPVAPVAGGGSTVGQKSAWAGATKSNQQGWSAQQVSAIGVQPKSVEQSNAQTVINPDGSYMFSYSTGDHSRQESADAKNNVVGTYSWKGDGTSRKIDYHAGAETGFVATGDGLIPVPEVKSHTLGKNVWSSGSQSVNSAEQGWTVNSADQSHQEGNDGPSDASYAFSYKAADHARDEASDAQGNVKGTFSFVADDGVQRQIDYTAGAEQGFVANGAHIPVAPEASAPAATKVATGGPAWAAAPVVATYQQQQQVASGSDEDNGDASYAYSYQTDTSAKEETSDAQGNVAGSFQYVDANGENRKLSYTSRGEEGFIASGDHLPVAGVVPVVSSSSTGASAWAAKTAGSGSAWSAGNQQQVSARADDSSLNQKNDGSYSFSYSTGDQSVQQASDTNNNVQGTYSFKAKDDGQTRTVNWKAGSETGFVASGAHLPVAPVAGAVAAPSGASAWSAKSSTTSGSSWTAPAPIQTAPAAWVAAKSSDSTGSHNNDGSYSYSYSTGDQSVQHSADAANNVRGSYSFKAADDGQTRKVDYTAGAATGFVATGAHLPVAPVDTGAAAWSAKSASSGSAWASQNTGAGVKALVSPPVWSPKTASIPAVWSAQSGAGVVKSAGSQSSNQNNDGSYSYSYSTDTQNVQQSSDANNNVKGSYSFKAKDDGQLRTVNWQAGSGTGFVAQGAHLPVAPVGGSSLETRLAGLPAQSHGGSSSHSASGGQVDELDNGDASYAYSYKTDTSAKEETSDAKGNVVGSFTFLGGDGVSRKLSYTARNEDGFNAQGAHLPVAPSVDGVVSAQQATLQSRPYAPLPVVRSHGAGSSVAHVAAAQSHAHAHAHGQESRDGNVVITKYLPPDSHHKYGYIFDTKA